MSHLKAKIKRPVFRKLSVIVNELLFNCGNIISNEKKLWKF